MDFAVASSLFQATAAARGWQVVSEGKEVLVQCKNAGLRLRPCGAGVMLEVTHGPVNAPSAGWLDIYSDPAGPDAPNLAECIEYGLDLMQPTMSKSIEAEQNVAPDPAGI